MTWRAVAGAFAAFLLLPLLLVVGFSFTGRTLTNFPFEGPSLRWWAEMLATRQFPEALGNSLLIAAVVGVLSAAVGSAAAIGLSLLPARRSVLAIAVLCLPLMLPPLVLGVALASFYVAVGLRPSLLTVILSHLLFTLPFVIVVVYARMASFDHRVVESARDLDASAWTAFRTVTLPLIQPTLVGAALLAVALSLDDFVITFFTIGGGNTLPTLVWGMVRTSLDPTINAMATLLIALSVGSTVLALRLSRYRG